MDGSQQVGSSLSSTTSACPNTSPTLNELLPFSHPLSLLQVSSATSGTMVLFSSSTALVALAVAGRLNLQYAGAFSLASMVASLLGSLLVGRWVRCMSSDCGTWWVLR